jgi:hypothetical protein
LTLNYSGGQSDVIDFSLFFILFITTSQHPGLGYLSSYLGHFIVKKHVLIKFLKGVSSEKKQGSIEWQMLGCNLVLKIFPFLPK